MSSKFSSFEDWKIKLKEESQDNYTCVLVEGKRDLKKLSSYGISNIIVLQGKKYYDVVESILNNFNKCIILFDVDKHGDKMFQKFSQMLKAEGIQVDSSYRDYIKSLNIEEIENLP
ncbi:toprim domain-containing protein [Sulfurihydrogenibium azorense]|uniref:toprim domain-containing protein n=1 Tax=Sulfurihydrogenibium azorense TaxID=309806 RepID=UPI0002DE2DC1|nr:toprim domain-containing protein [Sulfurihydrogenibium azorense]MDM7273325.1 toprim domain-containing protein [Sulfurihydrogenibium azorense]